MDNAIENEPNSNEAVTENVTYKVRKHLFLDSLCEVSKLRQKYRAYHGFRCFPPTITAPRGGLKYRKKCRVSGPIFSD